MKYYNLTTPQKNIWNLQKYYGDTAIGNQCGAIFYKEKRDNDLLKRAIYQVIENQSGIRLHFMEKEEPIQYISKELEDIPVMTFGTMDDFDKYAESFAKDPIALDDSAMYRFVVFEAGNRCGVLVVLSHLISDAWTFGIIANQVDEAYRNLAYGTDYGIWKADYTEYAQTEKDYFASERYKKDKTYWENKYTAQPEKSIIKMLPAKSDNIEAKRYTKCLSAELEKKIDEYCNTHSVTPAVLFETVLITYLARINTENRTITIGIPVLNRSNAKEKKIAGMFVSTIPLTVDVKEEMEITELAQQISKGHMEIFRHQKYPYSDILKYLREKQNFSGNLYDVMISYQNAKTDTGAFTKWYFNGYSEIPFAIHIDNRDSKSIHTINVDYQIAVFKDEREVEYVVNRLEYILEQIVDETAYSIKEVNIVPQTEMKRIIEEFNDTYVEYPREKCIHELFTEQAKKTPDKIALVFEDEKFTYKQLDEMSNSLAHYLREKGVKRNDIVPIVARRSWHVIVAMLGIMKAGGAYMPVSPEFPLERIKYMFEISDVRLALTYGYIIEKENTYFKDKNIEIITLDSIDYFANTFSIQNQNQPEDFCYIIFTSGSTGQPKGVVIRHQNVVNYSHNNGCNVCGKAISRDNKRFVSVTNIVFDIFVTESLLPLVNGMNIYMANDDEVMSQSKLSKLIIENNIDVLQTTPTKMRSYLMDRNKLKYLSVLKTVVFGGEALPEKLVSDINKYTDAKIYNIYGPAETTVWSTNKEIIKNNITIGSPIANTQIYILDSNNKLLPIGVPGELCIAGEGVGKGYLNQPELTAEKFVPNPLATEENHHGKTMYHTGDLACWRADGEIEYLGRIDTQVKIRGLRIELGEIENVMSSFRGIQLTAVADKRDENNRQYLVGYYTSEQELDEKELRNHLSSKLPKYMVPNYFMKLETMPMTASGKTDRKNLPAPDFAMQEREYVAPESLIEKKLANIWQKYLQVDKIGKNDDFFECGGDSLVAITMISEIEEEFNIEISIKDIMENSVLENLAKCIEGADSIVRIKANNKNLYKLLPQQKALYVTYSKNPQSLAYNMPARICIPDGIDINRLKESIIKAIKHHKILFSHIESDGQELMGVYDNDAELVFEQYERKDTNEFVRPFDLAKAPLVRVGITENEILFDMHHIVADGETLNIILKDIIGEYEGKNVCDEKITYGDYAEFFYQRDMTRHKEYFVKQLKCDFEPVILSATKNPIEEGCSKVYKISETTVSAAKNYARKHNMTDTMVFWGTYGILLSKYSGNSGVLSSIVLKNRIYADTKDMAGMFVNTLPAHMNVSGSVNEYMEKTKRQILGLFEHQELPFALIADTVGMKDKSVVNTSFVYQADGDKSFSVGEKNIVPESIFTNTSKFDLTMELTPVKDGMKVRMEFDGTKYDEILMDRLVSAYVRILEQLDRESVSEIDVMSPEEYHKVIEEFNDTYVEYPGEKCVHELFAEQVTRTPDKIALIFEDKKFTYRQLDEMSNVLAHYLREKGVKRNDVVPIIARRSWHVIVAMLGVMKAGGAYMPVDPNYPEDRIEYMLEETKSKIILSYGYMGKNYNTELVELENINYSISSSRVISINSINDSCYVLFTSGSTGKPKATIISHANLGNFVDSNVNNKYQCAVVDNCKMVLADTAFTFDISVFEIYLTLLNGLTVILSKDMADASYLAKLIKKYDVDVFHCTPTKILMLLQNDKFQKAFANIKIVMIGAENFSDELYKTISTYTDAAIYNGYGPTETTIGCSFKKLNKKEKCVHELFTEQVKRIPDKIALVFEDKKFTYKKLDEMSNALAHYLRNKGVKRNDVIPIIAKRSWHVIVAMLGVIKAGGAYMLIDYQYPNERIEYLVKECNTEVILTYGCKYIGGISLEFQSRSVNKTSLKNINVDKDIFCVIHTSGSTGAPKGTALTHKNIARYIEGTKALFEGCKQAIASTIITFDAFVQETIVALCNGLSVVLLNEDEITKQEKFELKLMEYQESFLFETPTKLLSYIRNSNDCKFITTVKSVVLGGEVFPQELNEKINFYNTHCRIYNIYGPTETTICCSIKQLVDKVDITIGNPIANTQIYILDKNNKPLPIGVPGELCIAGEGVGKGYLNRPELTAEKFVPNPFATEENHHGKIMYYSGDLACWRADGEIEYLGRIDTQVKIRGLRIELGEIENVMSSFAGIQLTAVADKRDENKRQYLVGYYTSEQKIDEKELRKHLASKLPKYMVPNYFMRLEAMPMTASGKTDRKNLPVPDFAMQEREYVAPETEMEIGLCDLLSEILNIEKFGVEDDFFEYGGDSLAAIEYVAKAHGIGVELSLQNVFDYPTVRALCNFLQGEKKEKVQYKESDFDRYRAIFGRNVVNDDEIFEKKSLGNILLTGATGFLGAHVLDELMKKETGKIYCLVRSNKADDRRGRLSETLQYYFGDKYKSEINKRIIPVIGDVEKEGLSDKMPTDVQTVIHTAASVKHYGSYSYFYKVNAEGTAHVVAYAKKLGAKLIHISTLSVSGNSMADDFTVYHSAEEKFFYETSFYIGQPLDNVYIHSKFEAERKVYDAMLEGLDAKVIRVGNLTNRVSDYKFQPNYVSNAFLTRVKAILEFGLFPDYLMPLYAEFSPVDKTAEGIVKIAQYADKQSVFHLNSDKVIYFERFLEIVHKLGIPMEIVSGTEFNRALQKTIKQSNTEYIFEAFQNDMDEKGRLVYDSNIRIENDFTRWFLKNVGFEWNETDMEYIRGYIDYFRKIGYLEV